MRARNKTIAATSVLMTLALYQLLQIAVFGTQTGKIKTGIHSDPAGVAPHQLKTGPSTFCRQTFRQGRDEIVMNGLI